MAPCSVRGCASMIPTAERASIPQAPSTSKPPAMRCSHARRTALPFSVASITLARQSRSITDSILGAAAERELEAPVPLGRDVVVGDERGVAVPRQDGVAALETGEDRRAIDRVGELI